MTNPNPAPNPTPTADADRGAHSLLALLRGDSQVEFTLADVRDFATLAPARQAKILARLELAKHYDPAQTFDFSAVVNALALLLK